MLGLHLKRFVGLRWARIQEEPAQYWIFNRGLAPEVGRKKGNRALEICGIQEQSPALISGWDILAHRRSLWLRQGQWQIATAKPLPAGALFQIESVRWPKYPRTELRHTILPPRFAPVASPSGSRTIGPSCKIQLDTTHDEFWRTSGKFCIPPPTKSALDISV